MSTATLLVSRGVTYTEQGKRNTMEKVKAFADWLTKWFTVIVIVWAVFNYFVPAASLWGKAYTGYMLGIVLFGMGLTLTLDDFKRILTQPLMVIVGTVAHFIIMPLIAVALCAIFHLSGRWPWA